MPVHPPFAFEGDPVPAPALSGAGWLPDDPRPISAPRLRASGPGPRERRGTGPCAHPRAALVGAR